MNGEGYYGNYVDLCNKSEIDYFRDEDVKSLLNKGFTPSRLLEAARFIREKEKSPLLKLNLEMEAQENVESIGNLQRILEIACSSGTMKVTLDCIENAGNESIMLKVQAPFSALMMLIGSDRTFKWICRYPCEMHRALEILTERTAEFCIESISGGLSIISLADPSGIPELLGEKKYKEFCAFYTLLLLKKLDPYLDRAVVHICPRTSLALEGYKLVKAEKILCNENNYARAVLKLSGRTDVRILGHRCINIEKTAKGQMLYKLTPCKLRFIVRAMKESECDLAFDIYNEGIKSHRTILKKIPDKDKWLALHKKRVVAEYLGNIIGFASLDDKEIPELSVYVKSGFHSQGVGSALLKYICEGQNEKVRALIFADNIPSIRLHEKSGFKFVGSFFFDEDPRRVLIYEWCKNE